MDKSVKILPTSQTEATAAQALTPGSTVLLLGCFAFLKRWRSMMRISAERASEFLPRVLGNVPPG